MPIALDYYISSISSSTYGQGDAGKIAIDTQHLGKILLSNRGLITSRIATDGVGNGGDLSISATSIDLSNSSFITSTNSSNQGATGNVTLSTDRVTLNNSGISSESTGTSGGNLQFNLSDLLLMRNTSTISTTSGSTLQNGNGGNITISSPLIIATPGNNDISNR